MRPIPETENALVLRTDFSNEASWKDLRRAILEPVGNHSAHVTFVSDPEYEGISKSDLLHALEGTARSYLFIVDEKTLADTEFPIIALDLFEDHIPREYNTRADALRKSYRDAEHITQVAELPESLDQPDLPSDEEVTRQLDTIAAALAKNDKTLFSLLRTGLTLHQAAERLGESYRATQSRALRMFKKLRMHPEIAAVRCSG